MNPFAKHYDAIYYFKYDALHKEKLHKWDRQPLVYPLDIGSKYILGVNLHWVPIQHRIRFINMLKDINKSKLKTRKRMTRIVYQMMKQDSILKYSIQGIRLYISKRMSKVQIIDRDKIGILMLPRYRADKVRGGKA